MRRAFFFGLLFSAMAGFAQTDTVTQRIFLIGDAGELFGPDGTQPTINWLRQHVDWNDTVNTAIFLGDNIYPLGLPMKGEPGYEAAKKVIDSLVSPFLKKKAKVFFIPGNHDWENGKLDGWLRVRNQHNYINGLGSKNIVSLPIEGCPGPEVKDLSNQVAVAFIDSQWFMYIHDKPGPESTCSSRTVEEFATELKEAAATHKNQLLLVVTHHPLYSFGVHGGNSTWKEIIFPFTSLNKSLWLPVPPLGIIYYLERFVFGNLQDIRHPLYQSMATAVEAALRSHPNAIMASGHDHSLQFIRRSFAKDTVYQIVSGAGSNLSRVKEARTGTLLFEDLHYGLSMLEVHKSGKVITKYYNIDSSKGLSAPTFTREMKSITTPPDVVPKDSIRSFPDSVLVVADSSLKAIPLRNLFIGKNFRAEWTTPVKAPVLNIGLELGGLTPERQGGGKQTRSLRVKDSTGKEWTLRTVQKFPDAAIPADLRETFSRNTKSQGVSAAYPFGSLSVATLANAAGVPYRRRRLVYIPDDPRLLRFRASFKNQLVIMEEVKPLGVKGTDNTDQVVLNLQNDTVVSRPLLVDQASVLKARLLDNFYMDFDRHEGQWDWAKKKLGRDSLYYPIPKDQDQIFYINQGIVPFFARKPWLVPELQGFDEKARNIYTFNRPARNFDRFFLNELDRETWSRQIDTFLSRMTDSVIEQALLLQPKEVRDFHYASIVKNLKLRRQYFKDEMLKYYDFLSRQVNIVGTNQRELFVIDKLPDRKVHVTATRLSKAGESGARIYDRVFDEVTTKQLMIYGLEERDSFVVQGGATRIKIRLVGGPGKDAFVNESKDGKPIRVYDVNFDTTLFSGNEKGFLKRITADPRRNEYNRNSYRYNYFRPGLIANYNVDDGLLAGLRFNWQTQGFRKDPFSTQHVFSAAHAFRTNSYRFAYNADFTRAYGLYDLLIRSDVRAPVNVTNFFGYGNNTTFDKNGPGGVQYYRARYDLANVSVLLRRQLQSWMRINYGPTFQYFRVEPGENKDRYISSGLLNGVDMSTLYKQKAYLGAEAKVDINSRNNPDVPTRGVNIDMGVRQLFGINGASNNLTQLHFDLGILASFKPSAAAVYGLRVGWYKNIGAFEIPQAAYLSGTENLRGFRRNRFGGRSMFFVNTEIRLRLIDFNTYLFPGAAGLLIFNDVGKVFNDSDPSRRWHDGYGGGIWVAPIRRWVVTFSVAHSNEEKALPYVGLGFRF